MYQSLIHTYFKYKIIGTYQTSDRCQILVFIIFRYLIKDWNVYKRIQMKLPRTNNPVEGFHNALNRTINKENPTLWNVLKAFQDEETHARMKLNHFSRGEKPKQATIFKKINENLYNMVMNYEIEGRKDRIKYLRMITYSLKGFEVVDDKENTETQE